MHNIIEMTNLFYFSSSLACVLFLSIITECIVFVCGVSFRLYPDCFVVGVAFQASV